MYIGVYEIINLINNKRYVGSTKASFKRRFYEHKKCLNKNNHHSKKLQNAWNKYGKENFKFKTLEFSCKKEVKNKISKSNSKYKNCYYELYDINKNLVGKFETQRDIVEYLNCSKKAVSNVVLGRRKTIYKHSITIIRGNIND